MSEPLFLSMSDEERERQRERLTSGGVLTQEILRTALDQLWNPPRPLAPPGYQGGRFPFGAILMTVSEPEWTVEADGWKLVIRDGAMVGLIRPGYQESWRP